MRIAYLTTDNREQEGMYHLDKPIFGPAPAAVLDGLKLLGDELEVHVVSCSKREMNVPTKIAPNIWFHQPIVPRIGWGRTAFAGCALAARKVLRAIQPDVVHGQGTERDCAISAVYSGFPNVLTIHGNMQRIYRMGLMDARSYYWLASRLETHALGRTAGVLCNSKHTQSLVEGRAKKTWLVANPLRPAFLDTPTTNVPREKLPVFLVVGAASRLKRPLEILETMGTLYEAGHRFKLRYIGGHSKSHSYGARFQGLLDEHAHLGYAEHAGAMDEVDLIRAMDGADALIHFPLEEAFGLVVAEALARGLKVFAAQVGGIPDILVGADGAEMFTDFNSLRRGIEDWMEAGCPRPSGNLSLMGLRYSPKVVGEKHLQIYREILGI